MFEVGKIRQQRIGIASENVLSTVAAAGAYGQGAGAEVPSAGDVVGRVADNDKLLGSEIELQPFAYAISGQRWKIAAVMGFIAKGAGQCEEF